MAAIKFIEFFESAKEKFINFEKLFDQSYFLSTVKQKININSNNLTEDFKNNIVLNLKLNTFFKRDFLFLKDELNPIYDLFKNEATKDCLKAQLTLLLHASKMDGNYESFAYFFENIQTIKIQEASYYNFFQDIFSFINDLVKNKSVENLISRIINDICDITPDFGSKVKILFFESKIFGLYGFAGVSELYISLKQLNTLYQNASNYESNKKILLLKLRVFCLVVHEMTHVFLRKTLDDFNLSSLRIKSKSNFRTLEAGVTAEKKVFKIKIDWNESIKQMNIDYCFKHMERFLRGETSDFNLEDSKLVESKKSALMAVSYEPFEFINSNGS